MLVAGEVCVAVVLVVNYANADPLQIGIGLEERYSDNINLSASDPKSDLLDEATLSLNQKTDPGVCGSNLDAQARYIHYQSNTYADHTNLNGSWKGNCNITDSLQWLASDYVTEQTLNTNQPSTPNNQTRENIFSTGPQYLWRISPRDNVMMLAQAQRTTFAGQSQNNSKHYIGNANYSHQVSSNLVIGTGGSINRGDLDNGQTLTIKSANVNFQKSFITTKVSGQFGYSWLNNDYQGLSSQNKGATWSIRVDKQLSKLSHWYAQYARELTDTSSSYAFQFAGLTFNVAQTTAVQVTHWRTGYNQGFTNEGKFGLSVGKQKSVYVEQGYTDQLYDANMSYSQPIVTNLSGSMTLSGGHQSDDLSGQSYNIYSGSVALDYRRTRQLSFKFGIGRKQRAGGISGDNYQENWAMVGANYLFR